MDPAPFNTILFDESPQLVIIIIILTLILIILAPHSARKWITSASALIFAFLAYFYRTQPPADLRDLPNNVLVAPSAGKVLFVREMTANAQRGDALGELPETKYIHIAAFLSPLDVHIQYAPCDLMMLSKHHRDGQFNPAFLEKSKYNEHQVNIFQTRFGIVKIIQIAGFFVRRIASDLSPGNFADRGAKIGMIKFGSRVDIIVPKIAASNVLNVNHPNYKMAHGGIKMAEVLVREGDTLTAGITPIVRYITN